jgi:hypothetical protein
MNAVLARKKPDAIPTAAGADEYAMVTPADDVDEVVARCPVPGPCLMGARSAACTSWPSRCAAGRME